MPINSFENYPMSWKPTLSHTDLPLYKALALELEQDIKRGALSPGDMLPPQRELADFLDLNLSTISRAFKLCEQKGLIAATVGKGTFIASDVHIDTTLLEPQTAKGLIEMGATHPPYNENPSIINHMRNLLTSPHAINAFRYSAPTGSLGQKQTASHWLKYAHLTASANDILITSGGQNALCAILSSLFSAGDRIGTDPLVYSGIKSLAKMLGIQLVPLPWENYELSPEGLRNYCKNEGLKGIYLIPDFQNPTTHSMSLITRQKIASLAKETGLIIIEDGINSLLQDDPLPPIATLAPEQTIYISSVSKILCPALRIAFMVCPPNYKATLELALYNINMMVSPINTYVVDSLITSGLAYQILSHFKQTILERNQLVEQVLGNYTLLGDRYCNFRFLLLPEGWSGKSFEMCAKKAGVQVYCAERFAIGNTPVPAAVRLSITATSTPYELEEGLNILKSILEEQEHFTMI